jgi:ribosomal protein S18 acetylase RimI-like enzyme
MEEGDVARVVEIHLAAFPGFFLSFLGRRFLRLYYRGVLAAPEGIAFVCDAAPGRPAGFVAGTSDPRGFYGRLLRRDGIRFAAASMGALCRRPGAAFRLLRALRHPGENPAGPEIGGLFSIGVLPELQGTGAGRRLVAAFLAEAARRGCREVFLTTDRERNDAVNAFYLGLGFRLARRYETPEGRAMNEYRINLPAGEEQSK